MSENLILKREGETSLTTWIKRRIERNQNGIIITCGPTGSAKSYTDISLCLEVDPKFDVKKQVVFKFTDFMRLLNDEEFKKKKWKQIIYEEFQVSASNRNWQSVMNKSINYIMSTFRHQNIILHINAPYQDFLDSQTMKLVHMIIETQGIDRKRKVAMVKPKILDYNSKMKKYYEHSLYVIHTDGKVRPLSILEVQKPPEEACKVYELIKTDFTSELNKDIMLKAEELEKKGKKEDNENDVPLHKLRDEELELYEYIGEHPNKFQKDYAQELKLSTNKVTRWLAKIEKKGIPIKKYIKKHDDSQRLRDFKKNQVISTKTKTKTR